ncbi:hypothetical protein DFH09DRAFT_1399018 [Mycena vulgaris]|nr:hypothetical protein DFH09DRAFT_1399018 [Mycena vulgaris]
MTLIQTFPPEVLSQIFEVLDFPSATFAALVCRQWHAAAINNSALWLSIGITARDIERPQVIQRILARSKNRPISLGLRFPSSPDSNAQVDYAGLHSLLRCVVGKHLVRTACLFVHAHEAAWPPILAAFAGARFPVLRVLDLRNDDAVQWQIDCTLPPAPVGADHPAPMPPKHLVFPLPPGHQLFHASLQGLSLGDARLPSLYSLTIAHCLPGIVLDGRLNPWLFAHAWQLSIEHMCVPVLAYPPALETKASPPARVEYLQLSELCATPRWPPGILGADGSDEHDCGPFFCALNTSRLHALFIDSFDLEGRIWDDFIEALAMGSPKFPRVAELKLRQMNFLGMAYAHVAFLLHAFPALQRLVVVECLEDTWHDLVAVLEMCPTLCVGLRELQVGTGIILRDDPMPFREPMFYSYLPLEEYSDSEFED